MDGIPRNPNASERQTGPKLQDGAPQKKFRWFINPMNSILQGGTPKSDKLHPTIPIFTIDITPINIHKAYRYTGRIKKTTTGKLFWGTSHHLVSSKNSRIQPQKYLNWPLSTRSGPCQGLAAKCRWPPKPGPSSRLHCGEVKWVFLWVMGVPPNGCFFLFVYPI